MIGGGEDMHAVFDKCVVLAGAMSRARVGVDSGAGNRGRGMREAGLRNIKTNERASVEGGSEHGIRERNPG